MAKSKFKVVDYMVEGQGDTFKKDVTGPLPQSKAQAKADKLNDEVSLADLNPAELHSYIVEPA
jgi:hypothetical protein